jgi:hypothetical protein
LGKSRKAIPRDNMIKTTIILLFQKTVHKPNAALSEEQPHIGKIDFTELLQESHYVNTKVNHKNSKWRDPYSKLLK